MLLHIFYMLPVRVLFRVHFILPWLVQAGFSRAVGNTSYLRQFRNHAHGGSEDSTGATVGERVRQ